MRVETAGSAQCGDDGVVDAVGVILVIGLKICRAGIYRLDIFFNARRIIASDAVSAQGVGAGSQAEVWGAVPVGLVVHCRVSRQREIRDFVVTVSGTRGFAAQYFIHLFGE